MSEKVLKMAKPEMKADETPCHVVACQDFALGEVSERGSHCQSQVKEAVEKHWHNDKEVTPTLRQISQFSVRDTWGDKMENVPDFCAGELLLLIQ